MRRVLAAVIAASALLGLGACSDDGGKVDASEDVIVLDVRTPSEFAAGHLEGAQLVDFNAGEVASAIPELDPEAEYLVYCRSGNRSSQATALMEQAGFTNITNLGSLEEASEATGIEIVR
ncbi:rhodanese-like domain-containing protein [Flaviflexus huanghaiensis]|uniref:rhodanese-like domain-containing protein n=1 Tax=Flaviflexus huanghaiensis TaxID=1111473 RepID=UPI0015F86793|nr:rhodanese-like domain-containing protein [Flaviflexus huanghaiensis]